jgi:hypothetical protein
MKLLLMTDSPSRGVFAPMPAAPIFAPSPPAVTEPQPVALVRRDRRQRRRCHRQRGGGEAVQRPLERQASCCQQVLRRAESSSAGMAACFASRGHIHGIINLYWLLE